MFDGMDWGTGSWGVGVVLAGAALVAVVVRLWQTVLGSDDD